MGSYRVSVRIELHDEETGRVRTYDNYDHYYEATQIGAHEPYTAIENAICEAIEAQNKKTAQQKGASE